MGLRPKARRWIGALSCLSLAVACAPQPDDHAVQAVYDKETGKLVQLTVDAKSDGKPNITSHMDGNKFVSIEVDRDEDGKTDRWEYYGADQKLFKVGFSRSNDGRPDAWAFQGPDGAIARVEVSTKRDGIVNRTEFYEQDALVRAEEDTDADRRVDKWEQYESGALSSVSFDITKSGKPTTTINYK